MVLKAYTGFSDRQLVEHLNGNIYYQMFCGIMIDPAFPITNYKIVSAIRNEIASRLDNCIPSGDTGHTLETIS